MNTFKFDNANRTYPNGTKALEGFSMVATKHEKIAVIGPSGCGKSTILRLISGLDKADEPERFELYEKNKNAVGYVFQEPNLMPWANVFDNIYMPMKLNGISRENAEDEILDMMKRLEIEQCKLMWPYELSGGMKMRVSIARALIMRPKILLLDEPFAALDEITRFKLNDLLLELHKQDRFTLVLVTHSIFESAYLCDRITVMRHRPGKIMKEIMLEKKPKENYRESKIYGENCATISSALREVMQKYEIE